MSKKTMTFQDLEIILGLKQTSENQWTFPKGNNGTKSLARYFSALKALGYGVFPDAQSYLVFKR